MLIACGINREGYWEVLGIAIGDGESEASWSQFFTWLKNRGLRGVDLLVSDDYQGLVKAVMTHFQGASWQRAHVHFVRNVLEACPKSLQKKLHARLRHMFDAPDLQTTSCRSRPDRGCAPPTPWSG